MILHSDACMVYKPCPRCDVGLPDDPAVAFPFRGRRMTRDGQTFERVPRNCIHGAIWRAAMENKAAATWYGPLSAATLDTLRKGGWDVSVRGEVAIVLIPHKT